MERNQSSLSRASSFVFYTVSICDGCYCDPFHGVARDSVIALRFTTIEDFDSVHHAGADVSDYFFENATKPLPQSDMLNNPHTFWDVQPDSIVMDCMLMRAPAIAGEQHQFRVDADLSDGRSLSVLTNPIILR